MGMGMGILTGVAVLSDRPPRTADLGEEDSGGGLLAGPHGGDGHDESLVPALQ
ncbi:hypothetical protein GCM10010365_44880 [Streptomyces poonensis]|uniref:Uncharacterized protein n=1 Tax=Streptomyces poonensis TaxID=68255 RepID=A0A918ULY0_9ACTN|nr:hypothetical protein GCM10010365_44880 [Streptomyces poonensis]